MLLLHRVDPSRPRSIVLTAAAVGSLAGLLAAAFLAIAGEPAIEEAIALEAAAGGPDASLVSRDVQRGVGLFGAYWLTGAGFGLLLAVAFLGLGRGRPDPFRRSVVAAALLAGAFTVTPWLKYPPNPPGVGDPTSLDDRQRLYLGLIVLTLVVLVAAAHVATRLREAAWSEPARVSLVAAGLAVVLLVLLAVLPPAPDPVPVPAALLWRFRVASLGGNLALWSVLGLGFGSVVSAATRHRQRELVA